MNPDNNIYYDTNVRETFRSVHPPSAPHEVSDVRSVMEERTETFLDHKPSKGESLSRPISNNSESGHLDIPIATSTHFEMATLDDCHDLRAPWPHIGAQFMRNGTIQRQAYSNLPLPAIPMVLQITHFHVQKRTWSSVEEQINHILSAYTSSDFAFEHRISEFLWLCDFLNSTHCSFQIRAYVDSSGDSVVIEMQRFSGNTSAFSEVYHSMRNVMLKEVEPLLTAGGRNYINDTARVRVDDKIGQNTDTIVNNDITNEMNLDPEDDSDSDINFLLIPVLEMLKNDEYPDMQSEALKMICELSATCDNRDGSKNDVITSFAGENARKQMRDMGYIPIIIDIICKYFTINEQDTNFTNLYSTSAGLRAITAMVNISDSVDITNLISKSSRSSEFYALISFMSVNGLPNHMHSAFVQSMCKELLLRVTMR